MQNGAMLNAYPDSLGKNLGETAAFLARPELKDVFRNFYILPSVFNTDLDHGFSVISYDLCDGLAKQEDLKALKALGLDLVFDLILNHLSVLSPQFQDILRKGSDSPNTSFFIEWNRFWEGKGPLEDGYIHPTGEWFRGLNLSDHRLPLLMVRLPDGREAPFWNTFYQQIIYEHPSVFDLLEMTGGQYRTAESLARHLRNELDEHGNPAGINWKGFEAWKPAASEWLQEHRHYLGQVDVDVRSPRVWAWYDQVMAQLADYGATTIRLDAFTRLHKAPGRENFMNEPETWDILARLKDMATAHGLSVLPEVHACYSTMAHRKIAAAGAMPYDYFLPGLLLDAVDTGDAGYVYSWLNEQLEYGIRPVNMLGCHDGVPVRDLRGLLPDERIEAMAERTVARGGLRKMIHGTKPETYQLNTTYFSALGRDGQRLLLTRAVQIFMPGIPQVWYEDLFAGENDLETLRMHPELDEREINRRSYSPESVTQQLERPIVQKQLSLLRFRNTHPAFSECATIEADQPEKGILRIIRRAGGAFARLTTDFARGKYMIETEAGPCGSC